MCSWLKNKKKRTFLLIEVLLALLLIGALLPPFIKDQYQYGREVKKLNFYNHFENGLRQYVFNLHLLFYAYYEEIEALSYNQQLDLEDHLTLDNQLSFTTKIKLQRLDKQPDAKYLQIRFQLEIVDLPYGIKNYSINSQNYCLKKRALGYEESFINP